MSKKTLFTNVTPLPPGISREYALAFLRDHGQMIDMNPLVESRVPCRPPPKATPEEAHCAWYQITDLISYGGIYKSKTTYYGCFHDLPDGLQTHVLAPAGLDIKGRWVVGGTLPGELRQPVEIGYGIPQEGLYIREDVEMRCNIMLTSFVKKSIQRSHKGVVEKLIENSVREGAVSDPQLHRSRTVTTHHGQSAPPPYSTAPVELDTGQGSNHLPAELAAAPMTPVDPPLRRRRGR